MKAYIETIDGKLTLRVFYDPARCNWDEAIAAGLASYGLKQGQAEVLALPFPNPGGNGRAGRIRILGINRIERGKKRAVWSLLFTIKKQ